MVRTQLYLEEDLWKTLQIEAKAAGLSMSELVRQTLREKYRISKSGRQRILMGIVGLWKDRTDLPETETYVRRLRKSTRSKRWTA